MQTTNPPSPSVIAPPSHRILLSLLGSITLPLGILGAMACNTAAASVGLRLLQSKSLLVIALLCAGISLGGLAVMLWAWLAGTQTPLPKKWQTSLTGRIAKAVVWLLVALLPSAHSWFFTNSALGQLLAGHMAARLLLMWMMVLLFALMLRLAYNWQPGMALLASLLVLGLAWQVMLLLAEVNATPFALGWSEGSRFYQAALFFSRSIFAKDLPLPTLNPTLHMLYSLPFLVNAPIWLHRLWRVVLLLIVAISTAWAMARRFRYDRSVRLAVIASLVLLIITLPVYVHLLVAFLLIALFVNRAKPWQSLLALVMASAWAGLSRFNWYPVPAMFAVALWLLDVPQQAGRPTWRTVIAALATGVLGTGVAALAVSLYMRHAGTSTQDFYVILTQSLLFARLLPSETFPLGVLPAIVLYSLPLWAVLWLVWGGQRANRPAWLTGQGAFIMGGMLLALFAGGLLVSTKIGGGGDIHNLDAYGLLLMLLVLAALSTQPGQAPVRLPWLVLAAMGLVLCFMAAQKLPQVPAYNPYHWQITLHGIQDFVDEDNADGLPTLFISQRQLPALGLIRNLDMLPEYDREDMMDRAMAGDAAYLDPFAARLAAHEFGAIVVDELIFTYKGTADAMGEEHNAWSKWVIRPILCHYQLAALYAEDKVAIYTPRLGPPKCPALPGK